jgi:gluconolactonase
MEGSVKKPKSKFRTIAESFQGKRLNSPNDLVIHSSGAIFFTDPPYGLPGQMDDPGKELNYQGVYRVDPDGIVALLTENFTRPNGIALSPDEKTIYVANSDPEAAYWAKFDVADDLSLVNETAFHVVTDRVGTYPGLPDGLKVDSEGIIYASGPGGIFVFTPEGTELGRIMTGQATSNCALDDKEEFLYITADMYLLRVRLK